VELLLLLLRDAQRATTCGCMLMAVSGIGCGGWMLQYAHAAAA
jgi:hypothetical protein